MSTTKRLGAAGCLLLWSALSVQAKIVPNALISNGMVLQQKQAINLWGTADADEQYTVKLDLGSGQTANGTFKAEKNKPWKVVLPAQGKGGPYTLTITGSKSEPITIKEVYIGEVWVCSGQSNMEMSLNSSANGDETRRKSANEKIHLFTVPRVRSAKGLTDIKAKWVECGPDTTGSFSAVAYFFGRDLQKAVDAPVGLIHTSWGGTAAEEWTSPDYLKGFDKLADNKSTLYNGMISPLLPYPIKGAIWYQGESNAGDPERAEQYAKLFPAMIENWRKAWNQKEMPFLFVQLAPFMKKETEPTDTAWARLREAQRQTALKDKNVGMAVITDVGDEKDIHPKQKEPVGARLALAALTLAYGKKIEYSGPEYKSLEIQNDKAILAFKHVGSGLVAKGDKLTGFTIAGEDGKFVNADAVIGGDKVIVTSPKVPIPVAVRFGWANYPQVNLWNKDGLPASPFRTDDWPVSGKKK